MGGSSHDECSANANQQQDTSRDDKMEEDPSVMMSAVPDPDLKKESMSDSRSADVLFWMKNLEMQWRYLNVKIESAFMKRKQSTKEALSCAVMAIAEKQKQVADLKMQINNFKLTAAVENVRKELNPLLKSFTHSQSQLSEKFRLLKESITHFLETVPLVDGAMLGEDADRPDIDSLVQSLTLANQTLEEFSHLVCNLRPSNSRSISPAGGSNLSTTVSSIKNLEVIDQAGGELKDIVEREVHLMKEIGDLLRQKRRKQLQLNSMKIFEEESKELKAHIIDASENRQLT